MRYERIILAEAEGAKGGVGISEMQDNMRNYKKPVAVSEEYIIKVLSDRWGLKFLDEQHLDTEDERFIELCGGSEY